MTDLLKIRKGVEELEAKNNCGTSDFIDSKRIAYTQVLKLIDRIHDEQINEELTTAAYNYAIHEAEKSPDPMEYVAMKDIQKDFINGAMWQKEQDDEISRQAEAKRIKGYQNSYDLGVKHTLSKTMDEATLEDWYCNSIDNTIPPVWTPEHITELLNDFYVIPKNP